VTRKSSVILPVVATALMVLGLYVGAYLLTVHPKIIVDGDHGVYAIPPLPNDHYSVTQDKWLSWFFFPAEWLDHRLRPTTWKRLKRPIQ
jgi:hypothetical protein